MESVAIVISTRSCPQEGVLWITVLSSSKVVTFRCCASAGSVGSGVGAGERLGGVETVGSTECEVVCVEGAADTVGDVDSTLGDAVD
jgi:hypothetical protein